MNIFYKSALLIAVFIFGINSAFGASLKIITEEEQTLGEVFEYFADYYEDDVPDTYKYISLNYTGISNDPELYKSLQILVYLDLIQNKETRINPKATVNRYYFYKLSEKVFNIKIKSQASKQDLLKENTTNFDYADINRLLEQRKEIQNYLIIPTNDKKLQVKNQIFRDVLETIETKHYEKDNFSRAELMDSAIEGLAKGSNDKFTTYFPPTESKSFNDRLSGEYEGIGAYVDMEKPGEMKIVSPIPGSPAEKAGLKGGDRITKVDKNEITEKNSLEEVVSWIKGPKGTSVFLTVQRGEETIVIEVIREKIILSNISEEKIDLNTYYIQIKSFGANVSNEFKQSLENIKNDSSIKNIIIDLRNNGGGYLGEVTDILSYVVPEGENTAVVKYIKSDYTYTSLGYDTLDLNDYNVVILQNTGTASASEIMIGTLNDYFPKITTIGEKTYGKGSVQTIKSYTDGSSFKYTIAKWYTGKTQTGIDGIGIKPDIEMELDFERLQKTDVDNQLEKAKSIY